MNFNRRDFIRSSAVAAAAGPQLFAQAQALAWPTRPVHFVVPFSAGGGADIATRLMAEGLRNVWGGSGIVVENKPGANTLIAAQSVLQSPRDGNTFLTTISLTLQLPFLMDKVPFDPAVDFVPIGAVTVEQLILVISPKMKAKTLPDLLASAKANPGKYSFGSFGIGSASHLLQVELSKAGGGEIVHVPYKGTAPAVQAVLSGDVAMALSNLGTVKQYIAAGTLVPLAATGERRSRFVPDVPTLSELGFKGFETPAWIGVFAAKGVPQPIIQKLGADIQSALRGPEVVARLNDFAQEPGLMSVQQFQDLVKRDNENASRMIRAAGIRLE